MIIGKIKARQIQAVDCGMSRFLRFVLLGHPVTDCNKISEDVTKHKNHMAVRHNLDSIDMLDNNDVWAELFTAPQSQQQQQSNSKRSKKGKEKAMGRKACRTW